MICRLMVLALGILAFAGDYAIAQNIYWSDKDLGEGAIEGPLVVEAEIGDLKTIYMYYSPNGQDIIEGFDLSFSWQTTGIVEFRSAETFEYDITIVDIPVGERWGDFAGPAITLTPDFVERYTAVNV